MKKRDDTITVKTKSGRIKTKYKRECAYCNVLFYSYRPTSICCGQSHYLLYAYENNLRNKDTIALKANEVARKKGFDYRIGKPIYKIRGKNHHNWKGGVTSINDKIRKSREYKIWRNAVFERDNYTCVLCNLRGVELNADHIKSFAKHPELRLELSNGRTLCVTCHRNTDTYGFKTS